MKYILGINAYHGDASACLYKDGVLIAATEEERLRRIKHWAGLPVEAAAFCLQEGGITLKEVDVIAISRDPRAKIHEKIWHTLRYPSAWKAVFKKAGHLGGVQSIKEDLAKALGYSDNLLKAKLHFVEHHHCHLASAFYISPFEECALLSLDGMGDFTSTMRAVGRGNKIKALDSVSYPHSIGYFYTSFTQYLGFPHYGDEYKVMGLSPYGKPGELVEKVRDVIRLKSNGLFELNLKYFSRIGTGDWMSLDGGIPDIKPMFSDYLEQQFGPARRKGEPLTDYHRDLAAAVQQVTEETIFHLAEDLHRRTGLKSLCITGGVAQNSVANGKVVANTSFERLFVPPAGHDGGTSVGAALFYHHQVLDQARSPYQNMAYTGSRFTNDEIEAYLKSRDLAYSVKKLPDESLYELVADSLAKGSVVGWFQGRAEFGPRALGNRSIIADPRRHDAKDLLNSKIKRRESFRPFAPSILKDYTAEYFEQVDEVPYMEKVFRIRREKRETIPAVTHVDGTGRLQTVDLGDSPRYYQLISAFHRKTGVPILLNTSFNENEPIVNSPEHALECFLRTNMDMLVLENFVISRNGS
jgi:carbamoyltransferase